jgi:hypothetical protein
MRAGTHASHRALRRRSTYAILIARRAVELSREGRCVFCRELEHTRSSACLVAEFQRASNEAVREAK